MGCDKERSRTLQLFQGSPKNHETVRQLFWPLRTLCPHIHLTTWTRFWFSVIISVVILGGMVVCATPLVPLGWRVDGTAWAVIFPLAYVDSNCLIYAANPI